MRTPAFLVTVAAVATSLSTTSAQDWPQWRGQDRDAHASNFKAPKEWPKSLTRKWSVRVGEGVATPALVGDQLYVFARQDGAEVLRCLSAADGKELWQDRYDALGASGPAQGFSGPRSSPAVAKSKVVTLGVRGMLSSVDATTGKPLWRKDDFQAFPNFHPSSSPVIVSDLAIAQLGGRENGAIAAYDLSTGQQRWKWAGPSPAYASPGLLRIGKLELVVAHTEAKLVAINASNGQLEWELASAPQGQGGGPGGGGPGGGGRGGRDYKAATPVIDGQIIYIAGRGIQAVRLEIEGGKVVSKDLWSNAEKTVSFATPTLKNGLLFGLTGNNELYCLRTQDGTTAWSAPFPTPPGGEPAPNANPAPRPAAQNSAFRPANVVGQIAQTQPAPQPGAAPERPRGPRGPGGPGGFGGPGGRRGGMGGGGYGTLVDVGSALMALTPAGNLVVFEPSAEAFKPLATYKVSDGQTHAYPVASGNRLFIKDADSVTLWIVE